MAVIKGFALVIITALLLAGAAGWYIVSRGVSAKDPPTRVEQLLARGVRTMAIARRAGELANPVQRSAEVIAAGRAHFADHCAVCHANDGSGATLFGERMWPRPPDLRLAPTQRLTDGELFWIIENGIRFTGMPAWSTGTGEGQRDTWRLVHFIRHLPRLTSAELEEMESSTHSDARPQRHRH